MDWWFLWQISRLLLSKRCCSKTNCSSWFQPCVTWSWNFIFMLVSKPRKSTHPVTQDAQLTSLILASTRPLLYNIFSITLMIALFLFQWIKIMIINSIHNHYVNHIIWIGSEPVLLTRTESIINSSMKEPISRLR